MRVVLLVPYRSDHGRRDELWKFTRSWLEEHHGGWEIFEGVSPRGPFNRGAAINDAARKAGDWDVAVVSDADNLADAINVHWAVGRAYQTGGCVFPFDTYLYLDEPSTHRLMTGGSWFFAPIQQPWGVIRKHGSGIQALSRHAYDLVGGFPELEGWGHEDVMMNVLVETFTPGIGHLPGAAYHLYHGDGSDPYRREQSDANRQILADVMALSPLPEQLREYLQAGGHPIP
jgi:hypothetical protein